MSNPIQLNHASIVRSTVKAHLVEFTLNWTVETKGEKSPKISKGTKSHSIWFPKSELTQNLKGEIYVPAWLVLKKEEEIAEKLAYSTVEILTVSSLTRRR